MSYNYYTRTASVKVKILYIIVVSKSVKASRKRRLVKIANGHLGDIESVNRCNETYRNPFKFSRRVDHRNSPNTKK